MAVGGMAEEGSATFVTRPNGGTTGDRNQGHMILRVFDDQGRYLREGICSIE